MGGVLAGGCDPDCDDGRRVDGTYAVFHAIQNTGASETPTSSAGADSGEAGETGEAEAGHAQISGDYATYAYGTLVNGWTRWTMTWVPSQEKARLEVIDAKERMGDVAEGVGSVVTHDFEAKLAAGDDNCAAFAMSMSGTWNNPLGTTHTFHYSADFADSGDHLSGRFLYSDIAMLPDGVEAGSINAAEGEFVAVAKDAENFDTGFR
jgi:hypothetical protein